MNTLTNSVLLTVNLLFFIQLAKCTEYIPVYMWGTENTNERIPALHRINEDSFKDDILGDLKEDTFVVVFAEHTLSPEDFTARDVSGHPAFPYLSKLKKEYKTTYLASVQNPIKSIRRLNKEVTEISIHKLRQNVEVPNKSQVLIIDLNDAQDDEERIELLKRHDSEIVILYNEIAQKHKNVLALYTAHHTSWVGSEEVIESRKTRSLLQVDTTNLEDDNVNKYFKESNTVYMYMSGNAIYTSGERSSNLSLTFSAKRESESLVTLTGQGTAGADAVTVEFTFSNTSTGYWQMNNLTLSVGSESTAISTRTIFAPYSFSYACGDQTFKNDSVSLYLPRFQVQPLFSEKNTTRFNDPYNCVGFTTIPIWSGLFVTFLLLLIMTFGLTMIMDIKTMDRFDDAKGKTITVNASE